MRIKRFNESSETPLNIKDIFQSTIDLLEEPFKYHCDAFYPQSRKVKPGEKTYVKIQFDLPFSTNSTRTHNDDNTLLLTIQKTEHAWNLKKEIIDDIIHVIKKCEEDGLDIKFGFSEMLFWVLIYSDKIDLSVIDEN